MLKGTYGDYQTATHHNGNNIIIIIIIIETMPITNCLFTSVHYKIPKSQEYCSNGNSFCLRVIVTRILYHATNGNSCS
jgi:hypothetical protein